MELTKFERLLLLNQITILEKLDPSEAQSLAHKRAILENGFTAEYHSLTAELLDEIPIKDCNEVVDILHMHRVLRQSYDQLQDKAGVDQHDTAFLGFDGNCEGKQLSYTKFLRTTGRWTDTADADDLNSHWPMLAKYLLMLREWKKCSNPNRLTKEDIQRIVAQR